MPAARRLAQFLLNGSAAAEDAVDQAFENVLAAVQRGGGPTDAFRPYLLSAVREATATMPGQPAGGAAGNGQPGPTPPGGPRPDLVVAAFMSLPERWRAVLWHVCVEGESPAEAGALLGLPEPDAAELASQAREALSLAYHRRMEPGATNNLTDVDGVMRTLLTRGLIEEAGVDSSSGAILYNTSSFFLERMGMASLSELPEIAPLLPESLHPRVPVYLADL